MLLSPVSSVHHEALLCTTGCLSAFHGDLPAPGHDAAQAQPARGEVVVQRWHEGRLLHPGRHGQWQCADRTPGALLKAFLWISLFPGWWCLPRHWGMHAEMRGRRSSPLQLKECPRPNPDGGKGERLVSLAGGKPSLPRLVQGLFQSLKTLCSQ